MLETTYKILLRNNKFISNKLYQNTVTICDSKRNKVLKFKSPHVYVDMVEESYYNKLSIINL